MTIKSAIPKAPVPPIQFNAHRVNPYGYDDNYLTTVLWRRGNYYKLDDGNMIHINLHTTAKYQGVSYRKAQR